MVFDLLFSARVFYVLTNFAGAGRQYRINRASDVTALPVSIQHESMCAVGKAERLEEERIRCKGKGGRNAGKSRLLRAQSLPFIASCSGITPALSSASSHPLIEEEP